MLGTQARFLFGDHFCLFAHGNTGLLDSEHRLLIRVAVMGVIGKQILIGTEAPVGVVVLREELLEA